MATSHRVIDDYIKEKENPIEQLRDRTCDNTTVGRC